MKCPQCGGKTTTKQTRCAGDAVRRRHHCPDCGRRFSTIEMIYEIGSGRATPESLDEIYQKGVRDGANQLMQTIQDVLEERQDSSG